MVLVDHSRVAGGPADEPFRYMHNPGFDRMAYLISAHFIQSARGFDDLKGLPSSIGYRLYRHRVADVHILDAFRRGRVPEYPFQTIVPSTDIPLELPASLIGLETLYASLRKLDAANGFKRAYVNFALMLQEAVGGRVLSVVSDDDELDFTCTAESGTITRVVCRCGDLQIKLVNGGVQVWPLVPEFEEDAEFLTDPSCLQSGTDGIQVHPRERVWDPTLHRNAIIEWQQFGGSEASVIGLGSYDPPEDESEWELLEQSDST